MTTAKAAAGGSCEELEPLFDYSRVQPTINFRFDDTDIEKSDIFVHCSKRCKTPDADAADEGDKADKKAGGGVKAATVVDLEEEDWLLPPPPKAKAKPTVSAELEKNSALQELRKFAKLSEPTEDVLQKLVETARKELQDKNPPQHIDLDDSSEPEVEKAREKLVITIQDRDGQQQFRVYKDEKFDKVFKAYAKKGNLTLSDLTFVFDGDRINPASTPDELGLEDDDMIEVRRKSC